MMEDKKGLLGFISSPEGQGLLATVFGGMAGARRGQPLNSLGRAGMSGLMGYGDALERDEQKGKDAQAQAFQKMQFDRLNKPVAPAFNQEAGGFIEAPSDQYPQGRIVRPEGYIPKEDVIDFNQPLLPDGTPNVPFQDYQRSLKPAPTEPAPRNEDPAILGREKLEWEKKNPGGRYGDQRGQIVFDNQGNAFNVNPYTNEVRPVTMNGNQIKGAQYSPGLQGEISLSKALNQEVGQAKGESTVKLTELKKSLPGLEQVAADLSALGKKATYTMTGQGADAVRRQFGISVGEGAVARKEYISKVDNEVLPLLRSTFGAAFTAKEGESLKATLGDPNASPEEKDSVLRSFIQTKRAQIKGMEGVQSPARPVATMRWNPQTRKLDQVK